MAWIMEKSMASCGLCLSSEQAGLTAKMAWTEGYIPDRAAAYVNKQARLLKWRGLKDTFLTERQPGSLRSKQVR